MFLLFLFVDNRDYMMNFRFFFVAVVDIRNCPYLGVQIRNVSN